MKKGHNRLFIILILLAVSFMGIGYATVNTTTLSITGLAGSAENGEIKITNVTLKTKTENVTATQPVWSEDSSTISFDVSFTLTGNETDIGDEHSATYEVTILNDTISEYSFGSDIFRPSLQITPPPGETLEYAYDVIGIQAGDSIPAKTSVTFTVKLTLYPSGGAGTYSGGVQTDVTTEEEEQGLLIGTFPNNANTGNLTGNNTTAALTVRVMNSFDEAKSFTFFTSNNVFTVVDSNGNANQTFNISANTESQDFTIYIKRPANAVFGNSPQRFNLYLDPSDDNPISIGTVEMRVDVDPNFYDNEPPTISSMSATKVSNQKSITVTWTATDNYGIDHYDVFLYNNSNTQIASATNLTTTTYTFDSLSNGTYYAKVVAYDGKGNNSDRSTNSTAYSWTYTVRVASCTNCSGNPTTQTVDAGGSTTVTLSGNNGYNNANPTLNSAVMTDSVSGATTDLSGNYSNGTLTITNISGNVEIRATGVENTTCLVKGTKILLADGNVKNVEDVDYDDLLAVWNYNDGTVTYEYPLWIEKEHETDSYIKISFSDNNYLNIAGNHALYSMDHNKFITLEDPEFKVGVNVAILNKDNQLSKVEITKIETINEKVSYYFIGSTAYYNIIANDVLTTDAATMISNLYGFNDNAIWPSSKKELVENNILDYSSFSDVLPYYLYKGFRVQEAGFLVNYNFITLDEFKYYITSHVTIENSLRKPMSDIFGNNIWMVTTSLDEVNESNKNNYLHKEGTTYVLPSNNNVKKWYSTAEDKYYNPGDIITIWHGMHFVAIYEEDLS